LLSCRLHFLKLPAHFLLPFKFIVFNFSVFHCHMLSKFKTSFTMPSHFLGGGVRQGFLIKYVEN
jgi:hypothetical protein